MQTCMTVYVRMYVCKWLGGGLQVGVATVPHVLCSVAFRDRHKFGGMLDRLKNGKLNGSSGHKSMLFTVASIFANLIQLQSRVAPICK